MILLIASMQMVFAEDTGCTVENIEEASTQIVKMRGDAAAEAFHQLALCDASVAQKFVSTTVPTFHPNAVGYMAAGDAVLVGGAESVMKWHKTLDVGEQKGLLRELGNRCQKEDAIQQLFLDIAGNGTDEFWSSRVYQYLTDCRVESLQTLMLEQYAKGMDQGSAQYFSVMAAMARNLEGAAIPHLKADLEKSEDAEVQVNLIATIFEAVDENNENHADDKQMTQEVAGVGVQAIYEHAGKLQPEALLQARTVLDSLEAEAEADELAGYMYKAHQQPDGQYMWGLLVVENATCKKGNKKQRIYMSSILETGTNWADQLPEQIEDAVAVQWEMDLAKRCKGTGDVEYIISELPIVNSDALQVWLQEKRDEKLNTEIKKPVILVKDSLKI